MMPMQDSVDQAANLGDVIAFRSLNDHNIFYVYIITRFYSRLHAEFTPPKTVDRMAIVCIYGSRQSSAIGETFFVDVALTRSETCIKMS